MEIKASRTLVKSAPELWELADDESRMEVWLAALVGAASPIEVQITVRQPERRLAWQTASDSSFGRINLALAEKGFGTSVTITAQHHGQAPSAAEAMENLLDDLGSPERQPFARA